MSLGDLGYNGLTQALQTSTRGAGGVFTTGALLFAGVLVGIAYKTSLAAAPFFLAAGIALASTAVSRLLFEDENDLTFDNTKLHLHYLGKGLITAVATVAAVALAVFTLQLTPYAYVPLALAGGIATLCDFHLAYSEWL